MMPPGSRASLADGFVSLAMVVGQAFGFCLPRVRRSFRRRVRCGGHCERAGPRWRRHRSDRRIRQSATILGRVVSHLTITDPHHFLFGHRLSVVPERSARGSAYVVVALPDGRRRSVRIASTNLAEAPTMPGPDIPSLPRISARTLIPLMQHLSANLSLLDEKVIRDGPPTPFRSRCVSTAADFGKPTRPSGGRRSAPVAESVDRDANADCSNPRRADTASASDTRHARNGGGSC